ncbi:MAG: hypothetical protein ACYC6Z_00025 [Thermoleophilia bacterium]
MGYGMEHGHGHGHGCREHGRSCGGEKGHHACPICGMPHGGKGGHGMEAGIGSSMLVKKATKKLLIEKMKAKIDARWGEKLDAVAQEMVDMAEEKMKMKKEMWKHKKEMRERLHEILAAEMEED